LSGAGYLADGRTATSVFLASHLDKPLLVEGPAGVGKTELAKALAEAVDAALIRLQCYEGLDESRALYEWNYKKQLLRIQASRDASWEETGADIFTEEFLLERPLLAAIRRDQRTVLLIDEVDKADVEFEALLLEILSDFQVTVPELGTIRATRRPLVVLTSNATRELSEALKRQGAVVVLDANADLWAPVYAKIVALTDQLANGTLTVLAALLADMAPGPQANSAWSVVSCLTPDERDVALDALHREGRIRYTKDGFIEPVR
jgi:nucleoside-triphosphatase THEP1